VDDVAVDDDGDGLSEEEQLSEPVDALSKPRQKRQKTEPSCEFPLKNYLQGTKTAEDKALIEARRICRLSYHRVISPPPCYKEHLPSARPAVELDKQEWVHVLERKVDFDMKQSVYHRMHDEPELREVRKQKQRSLYRGEPCLAKSLPKSFDSPKSASKPSSQAKSIAAEIMQTSDTMINNGLLTIQELQNELGHGRRTTGSIRFGSFYTWMMSPQRRSTRTSQGKANWKKFDVDRDGRLTLNELEYAVWEWLGEDQRIGRGTSRKTTNFDLEACMGATPPSALPLVSPLPPAASASPAGSGLAAARSAACLAVDETNRPSRSGSSMQGASSPAASPAIDRAVAPKGGPHSRSTPDLPQIHTYSAKSAVAQLYGTRGRRGRRMPNGIELLKTLRDGAAPSALCPPIGKS
jgi:hypothetical protein